jgi:hypothetical protein
VPREDEVQVLKTMAGLAQQHLLGGEAAVENEQSTDVDEGSGYNISHIVTALFDSTELERPGLGRITFLTTALSQHSASIQTDVAHIERVQISPDNRHIVVQSYRYLALWRIADGAKVVEVAPTTEWTNDLAFLFVRDLGEALAGVTRDDLYREFVPESVIFTRDSREMCVLGISRGLAHFTRRWDLHSYEELPRSPCYAKRNMDITPDARHFACVVPEGISVQDRYTGAETAFWADSSVSCLGIRDNGDIALLDNEARLSVLRLFEE